MVSDLNISEIFLCNGGRECICGGPFCYTIIRTDVETLDECINYCCFERQKTAYLFDKTQRGMCGNQPNPIIDAPLCPLPDDLLSELLTAAG